MEPLLTLKIYHSKYMFNITATDIIPVLAVLFTSLIISAVWYRYLERSDLLEDLENDLKRIREREIFKKDDNRN